MGKSMVRFPFLPAKAGVPVFPLWQSWCWPGPGLACACSTWPFRIFNGLSARPPTPGLPNRFCVCVCVFLTATNAQIL